MGSSSSQETDQSTKITETTNIDIGDIGFTGDAGVAFAEVLASAGIAQTLAVGELNKPVAATLKSIVDSNSTLFEKLADTIYAERLNNTLTTGLSFKAIGDQSKAFDGIDSGGFDADFILPIALAVGAAFLVVKGSQQ